MRRDFGQTYTNSLLLGNSLPSLLGKASNMINNPPQQPTISPSAAEEIFPLILQLSTPHEVTLSFSLTSQRISSQPNMLYLQRETALSELSKRREICPEMAPILWHSFGTISVLLQEIIMVYPMLSPPVLSSNSSTRVCNALALLQCVASHPETKPKFMGGMFFFSSTISFQFHFKFHRGSSCRTLNRDPRKCYVIVLFHVNIC